MTNKERGWAEIKRCIGEADVDRDFAGLAIRWAEILHESGMRPPTSVGPSPDGGVLFEWNADCDHLSHEIQPDGRVLVFSTLNLGPGR